MNLPENIRLLMTVLRMSQQDVADEVGVSRPLVSTWVRGKNTPDVYQAAALAKAFDVPLDMLLRARPDELTEKSIVLVRRTLHAIDAIGFDEAYRRLLMAPEPEEFFYLAESEARPA